MKITTICDPLYSLLFNLPYHNQILRKSEKYMHLRITREPILYGRVLSYYTGIEEISAKPYGRTTGSEYMRSIGYSQTECEWHEVQSSNYRL